jgi:exodeoxyribonuclease-1
MQFAGQRTDLNLVPIGKPVNLLVKMSEDVLPAPEAILLTGITPQSTIADGLSEFDFLKLFSEQVALPGTIFTGFNSVRFDDEFMRFIHYRNFYDPYKWQWQDGRSKWDLLDLVRMTRALRPENIQWPVDSHGKSVNRLELLTAKNKLEHTNAHDALSDVHGLIALARLIQNHQPKLFDFLLKMRDKKQVENLVNSGEPFVYSSGTYSSEHEKTTIAVKIGDDIYKSAALVYDLRHDPDEFINSSPVDLAEAWKYKKDENAKRLPVKVLQYNRCPAVAPLSVMDKDSQQRLAIDLELIYANLKKLSKPAAFVEQLQKIRRLNEKASQLSVFEESPDEVDTKLYDGFFSDNDENLMAVVRAADPEELSSLDLPFTDTRLKALLPLYKARNFPNYLTGEERKNWDDFRKRKLLNGGSNSRAAKFAARLQELYEFSHSSVQKQYLIEELRLYIESIMPGFDEN